MDYSELYENKKRGSFDFPIELYYVDKNSPRYQMPLHWHLEYELITVLTGSFELSLDGKKFKLLPGDCAWIGDGVIHGGIPDNCIYECVVFDLGTFMNDSPICAKSSAKFLSSENGFTCVMKNGTSLANLADRIFEAMEKEQKGYEWITVGLMWQLMGTLLSTHEQTLSITNRDQIGKLKNVLTYIKDNYNNPITLEELANVAGMSPRYFCRAFSRLTGKTPIAYLNYYRIELACERLLMTDENITDIGFSCGFNDASYFSKVFLKEKGITPSQYKKQQ
ncbi:MAG: AraC family transcriptional regulator [Ruminococcus sp.]|nr:AraC family transcriptional regulator [Ruminococcus sp.]